MTPVLVMLEVLLEVLIPLLMANIIDVGIDKRRYGYIIKLGLLLVVMAMLATVFRSEGGAARRCGIGGICKKSPS